MVSRNRPDWTRPLPRALVIPQVMTLNALDDVQTLLSRLPAGHRAKHTWLHVAACLDKAAQGAAETANVSVPLQMVLGMEGVPCRLQ